ncbi:MAG: amidohydrolase [Deltaproteobacteria bacterium]|nr:amidohydrolase [Deltaproteobacteria bacterium]
MRVKYTVNIYLFLFALVLLFPNCKDSKTKSKVFVEERQKSYSRIRYRIDSHAHIGYDGFDRAIRIMDLAGIRRLVNLSGGIPGYDFEIMQALANTTKNRIVNFVNLNWYYIDHPEIFQRVNIRNLNRAKEMGAKGLKIFKSLGLGIRFYDGRLMRVDEEILDPIWKECGRLGLPVAIHSADPVAFFKPPTIDNERYIELLAHPNWSYYGKDYPTFEELIHQFENLVKKHPETTFIGVHFGNYAENPDFVGEMLDKYPNYYIDIAARVPEFGRHNAKKMHDFFIRYQDRILFGTDIGVYSDSLWLGSKGFEPEPSDEDAVEFYRKHYKYFETGVTQMEHMTPVQGDWKIDAIDLPDEVLEKLYYRNAEKILKITLFGEE